jgi:hypothetical protein
MVLSPLVVRIGGGTTADLAVYNPTSSSSHLRGQSIVMQADVSPGGPHRRMDASEEVQYALLYSVLGGKSSTFLRNPIQGSIGFRE